MQDMAFSKQIVSLDSYNDTERFRIMIARADENATLAEMQYICTQATATRLRYSTAGDNRAVLVYREYIEAFAKTLSGSFHIRS